MIPNKMHQRILGGNQPQQPAPARVVDPAQIPTEEIEVEMWDFNLPCGPSQFMIEKKHGDYVKEEKDRFKICHRMQGAVMYQSIYKSQLYFDSHYTTTIRVRVQADYQPKTK
jgi:hypothetical protein